MGRGVFAFVEGKITKVYGICYNVTTSRVFTFSSDKDIHPPMSLKYLIVFIIGNLSVHHLVIFCWKIVVNTDPGILSKFCPFVHIC